MVVYIKSMGSKIRSKIINIERHEQKQEEVQAESYKSTICHELRTPMQSIIFVLNTILDTFSRDTKTLLHAKE